MKDETFDRIWGRFTRVATFCGGMAILGYETGFDKADRPWLYAAAVGLMGLPVARAAEDILSRFSTQGPTTLPPATHPDKRVTEETESSSTAQDGTRQ